MFGLNQGSAAGVAGRLMAVAMLFVAVPLGGCFRHEYVVSGTTPEADPALSEWQHNFIVGIVSATRSVDLREVCPAGVSRVENSVSVANVLFHILTLEIYSPSRVRVYCRHLPKLAPGASSVVPEVEPLAPAPIPDSVPVTTPPPPPPTPPVLVPPHAPPAPPSGTP